MHRGSGGIQKRNQALHQIGHPGCGCRGPRTDIEVQRADKGASVRRARFHSSVIDRTLLEKGEDFDALVDTYVIFITEHDKYGAGLPLYHVERTVTELQHTTFGDGAHIIYVNGAFRDLEHPVGRLMHDMNCTDPNKMLNPLLAKEVRYLKETEGGDRRCAEHLKRLRENPQEMPSIKRLYGQQRRCWLWGS